MPFLCWKKKKKRSKPALEETLIGEEDQSAAPGPVHLGKDSSEDEDDESGYETPPEYFITRLSEAVQRKEGNSESWQMEAFVVEEQPLHGLEGLKLLSLDGKATTLFDVLRGRRVLLIFMRHFGCIFCSKLAEEIKQRHREVHDRGVTMVAIGDGSLKQARKWAAAVNFPTELYIDESLQSYNALGLHKSKKVTTGVLKASIDAAREGHRQAMFTDGNMWQQGGTFLFDESGNIEYCERWKEASQMPDFDTIIDCTDPTNGISPGDAAAAALQEKLEFEPVVDENVTRFRAVLEESFPGETATFNDVYLGSVLAVQGREFDYAVEKMKKCLAWRREIGLADGRLRLREDVQKILGMGSMYWHGFDKQRRPIMWIRPLMKNWVNMDREGEIAAHIALIEAGISLMPSGTTCFCFIADTAGLGMRQNDPNLMRKLSSVVIAGYPDRLGNVCVGPINALVRILYRLIRPLLPPRLAQKVALMRSPKDDLLEFLNEEEIPTFFGGPAVHPFAGDGFNWDRMMEYGMRAKEALG